jgi:hypothetical protein
MSGVTILDLLGFVISGRHVALWRFGDVNGFYICSMTTGEDYSHY